MSGRACKAAVCCSAVAAKVQKIDQLILKRFITDEDLLDEIIKTGEMADKALDKLVEKIRDSG